MMKVITGTEFNTSFGKRLIYNEQDEKLSVGDKIEYNKRAYLITSIVPPTKPDGKWALEIVEVASMHSNKSPVYEQNQMVAMA